MVLVFGRGDAKRTHFFLDSLQAVEDDLASRISPHRDVKPRAGTIDEIGSQMERATQIRVAPLQSQKSAKLRIAI